MYRIQIFTKDEHCYVKWAKTMEERNQIINDLVASGTPRGAITFEWLARKGY
jgi:hypothetical protein